MSAQDPLWGRFAGAAARAREEAAAAGAVDVRDYLREQSFEGSESGLSRLSQAAPPPEGAAGALAGALPGTLPEAPPAAPAFAGAFVGNSLFNISEVGEANSQAGETMATGVGSGLGERSPEPPPAPRAGARQPRERAAGAGPGAGPGAAGGKKKTAASGGRKPRKARAPSSDSDEDWQGEPSDRGRGRARGGRRAGAGNAEREGEPFDEAPGAAGAGARAGKGAGGKGAAGKGPAGRRGARSPPSESESSESGGAERDLRKRPPPRKRREKAASREAGGAKEVKEVSEAKEAGEDPASRPAARPTAHPAAHPPPQAHGDSALQLSDIPAARPLPPATRVASSGLALSVAPQRIDVRRPGAEPPPGAGGARRGGRAGDASGVVVLDALHVERPDKVLQVRREAPGATRGAGRANANANAEGPDAPPPEHPALPARPERGQRRPPILDRIPMPVSQSAHDLIHAMLDRRGKAPEPQRAEGRAEARAAGQVAGQVAGRAGPVEARPDGPEGPGTPQGSEHGSLIAENTEESIGSGLMRTAASEYEVNVIRADRLDPAPKRAERAPAGPGDSGGSQGASVAELRAVRGDPVPPRAPPPAGGAPASRVPGSSARPPRPGLPGLSAAGSSAGPSAGPSAGSSAGPASGLAPRPPPGAPPDPAFALSASGPGRPPHQPAVLQDSLSLSDLQRTAPGPKTPAAVSPHGVPGFSTTLGEPQAARGAARAPPAAELALSLPGEEPATRSAPFSAQPSAQQSSQLPTQSVRPPSPPAAGPGAPAGGRKVTWQPGVNENERPEGYVYRKSRRAGASGGAAEADGAAEEGFDLPAAAELDAGAHTGGVAIPSDSPAVFLPPLPPPSPRPAVLVSPALPALPPPPEFSGGPPLPDSMGGSGAPWGGVSAPGEFVPGLPGPGISALPAPPKPPGPSVLQESLEGPGATPSLPSDVSPADALASGPLPRPGAPFLRPFSPAGGNLALSDTPRMEESISSPKTTESREIAGQGSPSRRRAPEARARRQALEDSTAPVSGPEWARGAGAGVEREGAGQRGAGQGGMGMPQAPPETRDPQGPRHPAHSAHPAHPARSAHPGGGPAGPSPAAGGAGPKASKDRRSRKRHRSPVYTPESSDDRARSRSGSPSASISTSESESEPEPQLYDSEAEKLAKTQMVSTLVAREYVQALEEADSQPLPELLRFLDRASLGAEEVQRRFGRLDPPYNTEHFKLVDVPVDPQRVPRSGGGRLLLPQLRAIKGEEFLYGRGPQEIVGVRLAVFDPSSVRPSHRGVVDKGRPFLERHVQKISRGSVLREPSLFPVTLTVRDPASQQAVTRHAEVQVHHRFAAYDWREIAEGVSVAKLPGSGLTVWHLGPEAVTPKLRSEGEVFTLSTFTVVEFALYVAGEGGEAGRAGEGDPGAPVPAGGAGKGPAGLDADANADATAAATAGAKAPSAPAPQPPGSPLDPSCITYDLRQYEAILVPLDAAFQIRAQSRGDTILFSHTGAV